MGIIYGPRFFSFHPLGNKSYLEYDIMFMIDTYKHPYKDIMEMPSSRRNRMIKTKEDANLKSAASKKNSKTFKMGNSNIGSVGKAYE